MIILYLDKRIQNELFEMMRNKVHRTVVDPIRALKYFAVILDCTSDVCHKEQLFLTIRYVSHSSIVPLGIYEQFIEVMESTGKRLLDVVLDNLVTLSLNLQGIRSHCYDNDANTRSNKSGVQARLLEVNPRAFFSPFACHSLDLLLGFIAKTCPDMTFFNILQRLYVLFSASIQIWQFSQDVKDLM